MDYITPDLVSRMSEHADRVFTAFHPPLREPVKAPEPSVGTWSADGSWKCKCDGFLADTVAWCERCDFCGTLRPAPLRLAGGAR